MIGLDDAQAIDTTPSQGIPIGGEVLPGAVTSVSPLNLDFQLLDTGIAIDTGIPTPASTMATAQTGSAAGFAPLIVVALFALWAWKQR